MGFVSRLPFDPSTSSGHAGSGLESLTHRYFSSIFPVGAASCRDSTEWRKRFMSEWGKYHWWVLLGSIALILIGGALHAKDIRAGYYLMFTGGLVCVFLFISLNR
jgi:hypothetical protein